MKYNSKASLNKESYIYIDDELLGNDDQHQKLSLDFNFLAKNKELQKKISGNFSHEKSN